MHRPRHHAFTLVEILIVVVILGILAAITLPQFSSATEESRESSLKMTIHRVRQQIEIYQAQHGGSFPSLASFEAQMTTASDVTGNTAAVDTAGYPFGPYLHELPANPFTSGTDVSNGAVGSSAWYYDESTGHFTANDSAEHFAF